MKPHEAYDKAHDQMVATAISVKDRVRRRAEVTGEDAPPKPTRRAMVGTMNKYLGGGDMRKIVFAWLFAHDFELLQPKSSKVLDPAQVWALIEWIDWWKDEDETWHIGERFAHEAICVLNVAIQAYNMGVNKDKRAVGADVYSLARNAVDLGGRITKVAGDDNLSKIDKTDKKEE